MKRSTSRYVALPVARECKQYVDKVLSQLLKRRAATPSLGLPRDRGRSRRQPARAPQSVRNALTTYSETIGHSADVIDFIKRECAG